MVVLDIAYSHPFEVPVQGVSDSVKNFGRRLKPERKHGVYKDLTLPSHRLQRAIEGVNWNMRYADSMSTLARRDP